LHQRSRLYDVPAKPPNINGGSRFQPFHLEKIGAGLVPFLVSEYGSPSTCFNATVTKAASAPWAGGTQSRTKSVGCTGERCVRSSCGARGSVSHYSVSTRDVASRSPCSSYRDIFLLHPISATLSAVSSLNGLVAGKHITWFRCTASIRHANASSCGVTFAVEAL